MHISSVTTSRKHIKLDFAMLLLTDCMTLLNLHFHASTISAEKLLMIDITSLHEACEKRDITAIGSLRSRRNVAHAFKRPGLLPSLHHFLSTKNLYADVVQWVVASKSSRRKNRNLCGTVLGSSIRKHARVNLTYSRPNPTLSLSISHPSCCLTPRWSCAHVSCLLVVALEVLPISSLHRLEFPSCVTCVLPYRAEATLASTCITITHLLHQVRAH